MTVETTDWNYWPSQIQIMHGLGNENKHHRSDFYLEGTPVAQKSATQKIIALSVT